LALVNKIDLCPYVDFVIVKAKENLRAVNPDIEILEVSARTGFGMTDWHRWLSQRMLVSRTDWPGEQNFSL